MGRLAFIQIANSQQLNSSERLLHMDTILVVDDEKVIRDGCRRFLSAEGFQVLTAENGQEALEVLGREPVNVILCDLMMPVMGAIEVLDEITVRCPEVPLIIITGHGTVANAVECMKKGAYDFVTKPFRPDHLTLVVRRALEKQSLERRTRELQEERARNLYDLTMEQSRIKTIVNCMADGVLVTNRELEVVLYNPALMRLLERPTPAVQPAPLSAFIEDGGLAAGLQAMLEGQGEGGAFVSQELRHQRQHLRALSAPIYGPEREVQGTVTVFHDITTFRELDEMKSNFVHLVSHELRSPLATIKQQQAVICDGLAGPLTEKQQELLQRSQVKIQGLMELINDLLDVAKIESGHATQQQVPVQLEHILKETVEFMHGRAESQGIALEIEAPEQLPPVQADVRSMEEVFNNLVSNAINYSPDGGRVKLTVIDHGDYLEVRVSDTGVGIAAEEVPKIFDKFYRSKHPKTRQVIGTGLGLAIVKGVVEAHRGSVQVESELGVGTTFRILLPTLKQEQEAGHART
jgi:two-component system phosphate regulon sensor histidine kinase PhoR